MLKMDKIHEDKRGEIYSITGDLKDDEIVVFTCKKGKSRGGCIHNINDEYFVVLEGTIKYKIGDDVEMYSKGMAGFVPSKTPHYFVAQTDCIVAEWGATIQEKKEKHLETRKIVDEINEKTA